MVKFPCRYRKIDYNAIEIRILDAQECVNADIAIAKAIHAILKSWHESGSQLYAEKIFATKKTQKAFNDQGIKQGLSAPVDDASLLEQWQLPTRQTMTMRDVWSLLIERVSPELDASSQQALEHILKQVI